MDIPHTFERLTDRARKVMQLANQEARQRFNHHEVRPEHVLLGFIKEGTGIGASALKNLDVDLRKIRLELERFMQSGPDNMVTMGKLPETEKTKKVLVLAKHASFSLNHEHIGTEHILLGLMMEGESLAARVLRSTAIRDEPLTVAMVQDQILAIKRHEEGLYLPKMPVLVLDQGTVVWPQQPNQQFRDLEKLLREALGIPQDHKIDWLTIKTRKIS